MALQEKKISDKYKDKKRKRKKRSVFVGAISCNDRLYGTGFLQAGKQAARLSSWTTLQQISAKPQTTKKWRY